jgi:hypothetical protein
VCAFALFVHLGIQFEHLGIQQIGRRALSGIGKAASVALSIRLIPLPIHLCPYTGSKALGYSPNWSLVNNAIALLVTAATRSSKRLALCWVRLPTTKASTRRHSGAKATQIQASP